MRHHHPNRIERKTTILHVGAVGLVMLALAGCTRYVSQDAATGKDGSYEGAEQVPFVERTAVAYGSVTYPGGDRVDWKAIELPSGEVGHLRLTMHWTSQQPGLKLAYEVYDEWGRLVARSSGKQGSRRSVKEAKGRYLVQIYAPGRRDAGTYTFRAVFEPDTEFPPWHVVIPDPPQLPAVPPPPCDPDHFDQDNPACRYVCPAQYDPSWPGCASRTCDRSDPTNPFCGEPCPNPRNPDPRLAACRQYIKPPQSITGRIVATKSSGPSTMITINRGHRHGIRAGWSGTIIQSGGQELPDGRFVVTRVTDHTAEAAVRLVADQLMKHPNVELRPP